jgi:hypothetical protein
VLGLLADGKGGEHGIRLTTRDHYRLGYGSPEISTEGDLGLVENIKNELGDLVVAEEESSKSWYKTGTTDIPVVSNVDPARFCPYRNTHTLCLISKQ